jgi:hypothetical protein
LEERLSCGGHALLGVKTAFNRSAFRLVKLLYREFLALGIFTPFREIFDRDTPVLLLKWTEFGKSVGKKSSFLVDILD